MDKFFQYLIYGALAFIVLGCLTMCSGCSMGSKKSETELVEDMADNCKHGMKRASVKQDDDDKEVIVECAGI